MINLIPLSEVDQLDSRPEPVPVDTRFKKRQIGVLWIKALEGRGLSAKDFNGTSDPYLIFEIAHHKIKTTTIYRNLNPIWNEEFKFEIYDESDELKVVVMDEDRFMSHDFMGRFLIPIKSLLDGQSRDEWFKLKPRKWGEKVSGEVHLQLKYTCLDDIKMPCGSDGLQSILEDTYSCDYFYKFLLEDISEENYLTFKAIEDYKKSVKTFEKNVKELQQKFKNDSLTRDEFVKKYSNLKNQIRTEALSIYDNYIKVGAKKEVNLSSEVRDYYKNYFSDKSFDVKIHLFEKVQKCVLDILETDCFPRFMESNFYSQLCESKLWVQRFKEFSSDRKMECIARLANVLSATEAKFLLQILNNKSKELFSKKSTKLGRIRKIKARAVKDYNLNGEEVDCLSLKEGDIVIVHHVDTISGRWNCEFNDRIGFVPSSCLTTMIPENSKLKNEIKTEYDLQREEKLKQIQPNPNIHDYIDGIVDSDDEDEEEEFSNEEENYCKRHGSLVKTKYTDLKRIVPQLYPVNSVNETNESRDKTREPIPDSMNFKEDMKDVQNSTHDSKNNKETGKQMNEQSKGQSKEQPQEQPQEQPMQRKIPLSVRQQIINGTYKAPPIEPLKSDILNNQSPKQKTLASIVNLHSVPEEQTPTFDRTRRKSVRDLVRYFQPKNVL